MGSNNQPGGRAHSFKISDLFIVIDELLTMKRLLVPRLILGLALLAGILQQETEEDPLPDYYARLKLSHTASMAMIKKSFRKLAMQFHPDKNKDVGAEVIFQELSEAYSVLGSEEKKAEYDELYREEYQADHHVHHADDFTDEELYEVNIDTPDDIGPTTFEDLPRYGDPPPRHHYEDVPVEQSEETVEPLDDVQGGHYYKYVPVDRSEETVEPLDDQGGREKDVWGDLDDEALFKVLKFLADHDYEISKKTVFKEAQPDARTEGDQKARWKRSTDFNTYRHEQEHARMGDAWAHEPHPKYSNQDYHYSDYNNQFTGQNYRYSGKGSEHSGHEHSDRRRYSGQQAYPAGHDRLFDRYSDDHYYTEEQY